MWPINTIALTQTFFHLSALGLLILAACGPLNQAESPAPEPSFVSEYGSKTALYYEPAHGNQIEYYDPNGRSFLWYPRNGVVLPGEWREDGPNVCFNYGNNTYNPVTGERGGSWSCTPVRELGTTLVDSASGDVFDLATGVIPYRLSAQPRLRSISDAKPRP